MAESPIELLRAIRDEFRDLPERLANQLGKQREMVLRGELPGERREEEREESERGEPRRDEHGRFLPGHGGAQHQGAFAKAAGVDQELLNSAKHLGFTMGGPFAKMAAKFQHAESLFNAVDRFMKALAKSKEPKEEPAVNKPKNILPEKLELEKVKPEPVKLKVPQSFHDEQLAQSMKAFEKRQRSLVASEKQVLPPKLELQHKPEKKQPELPFTPNQPEKKPPALPPFMKEKDLYLPPSWAMKNAQDAAVAAGKPAHEVAKIGREALDFAHNNTRNKMAVHAREFQRGRDAGMSEEEATRAAHAAVVKMERHPRTPDVPTTRAEQPEIALSGSEGGLTALAEIAEPIQDLVQEIRTLNRNLEAEKKPGGETVGSASRPHGSRPQRAPNSSLPLESSGGGSDPDKNLDFARQLGNALKSTGGEIPIV